MESKKLKVLWVARGNGKGSFKPVVGNQFNSLTSLSEISLFSLVLEGKGLQLYIRSFFEIRSAVKRNRIDLIHAHYSFTAFVCALTFSAPVVVSLMGSDVIASKWRRLLIVLFARLFWKKVIVKTEQMKQLIGIEEALIIPNGVDLDFFTPQDSVAAKNELKWSHQKFHVVFTSDSRRKEKNFQLLVDAMNLMDSSDMIVHEMSELSKEEVRNYYAAADLVVMTSLREGSPNAIKEALSMNKCIVSTPVGDVKELFDGVEGVWLVSYQALDLAHRIDEVKRMHGRESTGRKAMNRLSSQRIAATIEALYYSASSRR